MGSHGINSEVATLIDETGKEEVCRQTAEVMSTAIDSRIDHAMAFGYARMASRIVRLCSLSVAI